MFNIGPLELMVILVVALLVVGPKRLPEVGRSIGRGLREFRKAQDEVKQTLRLSLDDTTPAPAKPASADTPADSEDGATTPATGTAEPVGASDTTEVARTLGKGLAELRRAREEIQRTFRIEPDEPPRATREPATAESSEAGEPATGAEPSSDTG